MKSVDAIRRELVVTDGLKCCKQQFIDLLRNPFYVGMIRIDATQTEAEEVVKGLHEPIIDEDTFNRVQKILNSKKRSSAKPSRFKPAFPLRGHLLCSRCGKKLTGSSSTGRAKKYHYYHCQHGCKERIDAERANVLFLDYLSSLQIEPEVADLYLAIIRDIFEKEEGSKLDQLRELDTRIKSEEEKLVTLDNKLVSGFILDEDYSRIAKTVKKDIQRLNTDRANLASTETHLERHITFGITMMTHLRFYYDSAPLELKHKILDSIFETNLIFEGDKYRTEKPNNLLQLINSAPIISKGTKTKQAVIADSLSTWAPPPGLEPGTL